MRFLIAFVTALLLFPPAVFSGIEQRNYRVLHYDLKTGRHLFTETVQETGDPIRRLQAVFSDDYNRDFAYKRLHFDRSATVPEYSLVDSRTGYTESVSAAGSGYLVSAGTGRDVKSASFSAPSPAAADHGVIRLIEANWDRLNAGEEVTIHFIVPEKRSFFRFRISPVRRALTLDLTIEPENVLLRQLVDPVFVSMDLRTKRPLEYRGIMSLMDQDGRNFRVRAVVY